MGASTTGSGRRSRTHPRERVSTVGLGFLLPVSAIVTTVILVLLTDTSPAAKATAVVVCVGSFLVPRFVHALWWSGGPLQLGLSIVIVTVLKVRGAVG